MRLFFYIYMKYFTGIVGGLSTVAVCAPSDKFLNWAGPLGIGLGGVFVASLGSAFLPPTSALGLSLYSISLYGGLLLFSAFLLYDTQKVSRGKRYLQEYDLHVCTPFVHISNVALAHFETIE